MTFNIKTIHAITLAISTLIATNSSVIAAPVVVAHVQLTVGTSGTSTAIDTTGATIIFIHVAGMDNYTLSDSKGNTYLGLSPQGTNAVSRLWFKPSPTVGSGHTFTITNTGSFTAAVVDVAAFSGVVATSPLDQSAGESGGVAASGCGSSIFITPSAPNELFVWGYEKENDVGPYTVNYGTIIDQNGFVGGNNFGGGLAWFVSSALANPFWGSPTAGRNGCTLAAFFTTSTPSTGHSIIM